MYKMVQISRTIHRKIEGLGVEFITECSIPAGCGRNHIPKEGLRRTVATLLAFDLTVLLAAWLPITEVFVAPDGSIERSKPRRGCSIE
jgi:hypothetical protein